MNRFICCLLSWGVLTSGEIWGQAALAKFEPPEGKQLLIIGQDLGAIGGFAAPNNDGYVDHIEVRPGGVTTYTGLPFMMGIAWPINLGSGDLCAKSILANPIYANSVLAIGFSMVGQEKAVAEGTYDGQIHALAKWIREANRPVFLRIGYEFDGSWNHYDPEAYKKAFQRVAGSLKAERAGNCVTVWQAATSPVNGNNSKNMEDWYPGDEAVDWVGYSWFLNKPKQVELTDKLLAFARAHHKPVMVCESAPQGYDLAKLTQGSIASGKGREARTAEQIWNGWYGPFFDYVEKNKDVVRVVAYINVNWDAQWMWGPPYRQGYWGDSRVEVNPEIKAKWLEEISKPKWMVVSPTLFQELGYTPPPKP